MTKNVTKTKTQISENNDLIKESAEHIEMIIQEVQRVVVGQRTLIRNLVIALLARGHILLEGVPGLAKTLSIETLAKTVGVGFGRVQFTPDLLPGDLVGMKLFDQKTTEFVTKKGPIFTNLLLADEINRAPAKVQSALLEAMAERQVTIGDERHPLSEPFVVMATQNPLEQEGTYSLPEAQLDRFLLKTVITYPTEEEELAIMKQMSSGDFPKVKKQITKKDILALQKTIDGIYVADSIYCYVKNLVFATRYPERFGCEQISPYIQFGVSPRASLALIQSAKVLACMHGRDFVLPEDIKALIYDVFRHRIILTFDAIAQEVTVEQIIEILLQHIPVVEHANS